MHKTFQTALKHYLQEETMDREGSSPLARRTTQDRGAQRSAFEDSLEKDTNPDDFKRDGLGFDPTESQADAFQAVLEYVDKANEMVQELNNPRSDKSLNRFLAHADREGSPMRGLSQKLASQIEKAANALDIVKNSLASVAAREPALRREADKLKEFQASGGGIGSR
jgi:hypothetical protein